MRVEANKTKPLQRVKYYLLYAFLLAAVGGSAIGGMFDPICIAVRSIGLGVIPGAQYVGSRTLGALQDVQVHAVQTTADGTQDFLAQTVWQSKQNYFHHTWLIAFLLIAVLFMNRFIPRFWCRVLCPLGAFLGVFARFALFGMEKDHAKCTDCNLCLVHCQAADSPQGGVKWRQDECHMCLNCENACPEDVIKFRFLPSRKGTIVAPDTQRRASLAILGAGGANILSNRLSDANSLDSNNGSKVSKAAGCGRRARVPRAVHPLRRVHEGVPEQRAPPGLLRGGHRGRVDADPHRAHRLLRAVVRAVRAGLPDGGHPEDHRARQDRRARPQRRHAVGAAPAEDRHRVLRSGPPSLPWAMATPCIVCEEFCPTSPKAIWVEEVTAPKREPTPEKNGESPVMTMVKLQRPHVDPSLCIGCGACEKVCPVQDQPAVYVTSVGESRSKTNVILLETTNYNQKT